MTDKTGAAPDGVDEAVALFESEDDHTDHPLADDKPRKAEEVETFEEDEAASDTEEEEGEEPEADPEDDPADDDDKESSAKLGRRVQKRIAKLTRKAADAEREGAYYRRQSEQERQRASDLERELAWLRQQGGYDQSAHQQYDEGLNEGLTPQQVEEIIANRADEVAAQKEYASRLHVLQKKLMGEAPEAFARISNKALTPFEQDAIEALSEATHQVQIAKALAGNEELFERFSSLPNGAARARLIARLDGSIDARLAAKKAPAQQVKPTPKVKGVTRAPEKDPNKMSQAEYEAWSEKQGW